MHIIEPSRPDYVPKYALPPPNTFYEEVEHAPDVTELSDCHGKMYTTPLHEKIQTGVIDSSADIPDYVDDSVTILPDTAMH